MNYQRNKGRKCSIEGCERPAAAKLLCFGHWKRQRNRSKLTTQIGELPHGPKHWNWKGGIGTTVDGRVLVYARGHPGVNPKRPYLLRYRLEMEKALGRPLQSSELVHHVDESTDRDVKENLELTNRSDHMKLHARLRASRRWARYYDKCSTCETVAVRHKGLGLCAECYSKQRKR